MIKRRLESGLAWMEVNISDARTSCIYGFNDKTNIHDHTVLSGSEIVYQRDISGANLIVSGTNLVVSGANLVLAC